MVKTSPDYQIMASRQFSLANRYRVESVNEVMKKNILLSLAYLDGSVNEKTDINWNEIVADKTTTFTLKPGETFAFHEDVLPEYKDSLVLTTKSIFGPGQGYLTDGYLYGDGVCHIASFMNWVAQDAGLKVYVPKDHRSVGPINEVPEKYGVSIYIDPTKGIGERNNLYVTNTLDTAIEFVFKYENEQLTVSVVRS